MLHLTAQSKILLAIEPVDGRKQMDGLVALCRHQFDCAPNDGTLYGFINRRRTTIKLLGYDKNGYWLAQKRLSRGRYGCWPCVEGIITPIQAHELRLILGTAVRSRRTRIKHGEVH